MHERGKRIAKPKRAPIDINALCQQSMVRYPRILERLRQSEAQDTGG